MIQQRDAQELASGYSSLYRKVEVLAIVTFFVMVGICFFRAFFHLHGHWAVATVALLAGWVGADFVSGLVHWAGDTWGSPDWPVVGKALIRPFREHHVDAKAMTHHDFIELCGSNCVVSLPVLAGAMMVHLENDSPISLFLVLASVSLVLFVLATNVIHKLAHMDQNPRWIQLAQKWNLILSPEHHSVHHTPPFAQYYCITTGWMNRPLAAIGFYHHLETWITYATGALPREDDIGAKAAEALFLEKREHAPEPVAQQS